MKRITNTGSTVGKDVDAALSTDILIWFNDDPIADNEFSELLSVVARRFAERFPNHGVVVSNLNRYADHLFDGPLLNCIERSLVTGSSEIEIDGITVVVVPILNKAAFIEEEGIVNQSVELLAESQYDQSLKELASASGLAGETDSLRKGFSTAVFAALEAKKTALLSEERSLYANYLFGRAEPSSSKEIRKLLNKFFKDNEGQEPSTNSEKQFLVRAIQHFVKKRDLKMAYVDSGTHVRCRITVASNQDPKYPLGFKVVELGTNGRKLATRNALPAIEVL